jgi:hypothetical protein
MQRGDRGGGGVKLSVELGALTRSIREFRLENAYFVILTCLAGCERITGRDARVSLRDYGVGPVHCRAAKAGFFPEVVFDQSSVGALPPTATAALHDDLEHHKQLVDLSARIEEHHKQLAAAREANRGVMVELNRL